ncbi:hypothetical protein A4D02_17555 [Niastella koreensis]|uniref:Uncharacterized protein n=1 Tax=Niastella koreensis TaxID=354356 RepID=A0ABX3NLW1_9BACT|nr:hypothetical protein A4D02_17555 [Niastella koreensis]
MISPNLNKLSADAKIASSWLRGAQPGNFFAFSLLAFLFLPYRATISLKDGLNSAKTRMGQWGIALVVTFFVRSPGLLRNSRAMS